MNAADVLQLEFASNPAELPGVRQCLRDWTEARGWEEAQISEIVLAVDEALTNVIRHGYEGRTDQPVRFSAEGIVDPREGDGVCIRIRDFGRQVALDQICGRDLDDVRPGGLGVHLIKAMTNKATYEHADGGGMLLTMIKFKTHTAKSSEDAGSP